MKKNGAFDRLCSALVLLTVISVSAPPVCFIMDSFVGGAMHFMLAASAVSVIFGYVMQILYARIRHIKRPVDTDMSYERLSGGFELSKAFPALVCDIIPAFAAYYGAKAYMEWRLRTGLDKYIDPNSLMPFISFAIVFVLAIIGTVIWFFPSHRVISVKSVIPVTALMVIWSIVPGIYFTYPDGYGTLILFCFAVCILSYIFVLGQNSLARNRVASRGGTVTSEQRTRILGYTSAVILLVVFIFGIAVTVYTGISVIFRSALYFAIGNASGTPGSVGNGGTDSVLSEPDAGSFRKVVFEKSDLFGTGGTASVVLFIIFIILITAAILFLILRMRFDVVKSVTGFFAKLIEGIKSFIREIVWAGKHMYAAESEIEYTETKQKLQVFEERAVEPEHGTGKRAFYRLFKRRLERCPDNSERLCYAYSVLVGVWKKGSYGIMDSDTPREILEKLGGDAPAGPDSEAITHVYELLRYADEKTDNSETEALLEIVCECIKKYYVLTDE